jgi:hypothetical protein
LIALRKLALQIRIAKTSHLPDMAIAKLAQQIRATRRLNLRFESDQLVMASFGLHSRVSFHAHVPDCAEFHCSKWGVRIKLLEMCDDC